MGKRTYELQVSRLVYIESEKNIVRPSKRFYFSLYVSTVVSILFLSKQGQVYYIVLYIRYNFRDGLVCVSIGFSVDSFDSDSYIPTQKPILWNSLSKSQLNITLEQKVDNSKWIFHLCLYLLAYSYICKFWYGTPTDKGIEYYVSCYSRNTSFSHRKIKFLIFFFSSHSSKITFFLHISNSNLSFSAR